MGIALDCIPVRNWIGFKVAVKIRGVCSFPLICEIMECTSAKIKSAIKLNSTFKRGSLNIYP